MKRTPPDLGAKARYAWNHCNTLTAKEDIHAVLEWFINQVKNGAPVNDAVLRFVAGGVERYLMAPMKEPWPGKRGVKSSPEAKLRSAYRTFVVHQRMILEECANARARGKRPIADEEQWITRAAEELRLSEDTVKRHLAFVRDARKKGSGLRTELQILELQHLAESAHE